MVKHLKTQTFKKNHANFFPLFSVVVLAVKKKWGGAVMVSAAALVAAAVFKGAAPS